MAAAGEINLDKLERELTSAIEADRKYSRENDAKFRAVAQRVATYEEFRDIVKASHLTSLDRKDIIDSSRKQPWNPIAELGSGPQGTSEGCGSTVTADSVAPGNAQEFTREWRKRKQSSVDGQYQFLLQIGGERLSEIFRVEISMGLLGEILTVLNKGWQEGDAPAIHSILTCLTLASRFSLSLGFLSSSEKKEASELLRKLSVTGAAETSSPEAGGTPSRTSTSELAKLYLVELDTQ